MRSVLVAGFLITLAAAPAGAQMGVPNTPVLPPGPSAPPFGNRPSPFNDPYPTQPWNALTGAGAVVREFLVPARSVTVPMEVAMPGSLPPVIANRVVTLPGYRVTETTAGFLVHEHWGVEPRGGAYYWTLRPTYFQSRR